MNKHLIVLFSIVMALVLACTACTQTQTADSTEATADEAAVSEVEATDETAAEDAATTETSAYVPTGKVVVYNANSEDTTAVLTEKWNALYPDCEIEFITAGSGELTARIEAEASNPQGDVLLGPAYSVFSGMIDYLEPYTSPLASECLPSFCGESEYFTPEQINVNTIIVNNAMIEELGVTVDSWESLLDPALKGNISYVDPSASSSAREQVINMLAAEAAVNGDTMDDHWDFISEFFANLDGKMYDSSSKVPQGVANGEYAVGITNEELVLQLMLDGVDVSAVYAKEGITLRNSFVGVIKDCANPDNAKAFIDFMISHDVQQALADECLMRSVRADVTFSALDSVPSSDELPSLNYPVEWVQANSDLKSKLQDIISGLN